MSFIQYLAKHDVVAEEVEYNEWLHWLHRYTMHYGYRAKSSSKTHAEIGPNYSVRAQKKQLGIIDNGRYYGFVLDGSIWHKEY